MRKLFLVLSLAIGWSILTIRSDKNSLADRWMLVQAQMCCPTQDELNQCSGIGGVWDYGSCSCACNPQQELDCYFSGGQWDSSTCSCDYPDPGCDPCPIGWDQDPITCECTCEENEYLVNTYSNEEERCENGYLVVCVEDCEVYIVIDCEGSIVDNYDACSGYCESRGPCSQ